MRLPFDLIVFDLETSGNDDRIVEIGAVRLDPELRIIDEYECLVDGRPVSEKVMGIHHITNEMLVGKPAFAEMRGAFEEWCAQSARYVLAGWGLYFDLPVLRAEYKRIGVKFPHPGHGFDIKSVVWSELLKRDLPAKSLSVDRALELLGIPFEGTRHRGLPDARMEAKALQAVVKPAMLAKVNDR